MTILRWKRSALAWVHWFCVGNTGAKTMGKYSHCCKKGIRTLPQRIGLEKEGGRGGKGGWERENWSSIHERTWICVGMEKSGCECLFLNNKNTFVFVDEVNGHQIGPNKNTRVCDDMGCSFVVSKYSGFRLK